MTRFYQKHYLAFYEGAVQLNDGYVVAHKLEEAAKDRLQRYDALIPEGGRVLDIGCGLGFFLRDVMRTRTDVEVVGIEPGAAQARYARERLGVQVFEGPYQAFESRKKFDLVTAFHVAEHVHDLGGFLKFMHQELQPGGYAVIESPNLEGEWSEFGMFHVAHLYAFTPRSLRFVARRNGFTVTSISSSNRGWDRPNLHATLQATPERGGDSGAELAHISADIRARCASVRKPRWRAVTKSWVKLALHYLGLGGAIDRISHRTAARAR